MIEIVWPSAEIDDTVNLVDKLFSFCEGLLSARNIQFRFEYPRDFNLLPLTLDVTRHIHLIVKEALNNIVRHARASEVGIHVGLQNQSMTISIHDNGCGFDLSSPMGNGLKNLHCRAEEIGGKLVMDTMPGLGPAVQLPIPSPKLGIFTVTFVLYPCKR